MREAIPGSSSRHMSVKEEDVAAESRTSGHTSKEEKVTVKKERTGKERKGKRRRRSSRHSPSPASQRTPSASPAARSPSPTAAAAATFREPQESERVQEALLDIHRLLDYALVDPTVSTASLHIMGRRIQLALLARGQQLDVHGEFA